MSDDLMRRVARRLWIDLSRAANPWFPPATRGDDECRSKWDIWNRQQMDLMRELDAAAFQRLDISEDLLTRVLDFAERGQ